MIGHSKELTWLFFTASSKARMRKILVEMAVERIGTAFYKSDKALLVKNTPLLVGLRVHVVLQEYYLFLTWSTTKSNADTRRLTETIPISSFQH